MAKAWAINEDSGQPEYAAQELRRIAAMWLFPGGGDRFGARGGVRPNGFDPISVSGTTWTVHDLTAIVYPGETSVSGPYVVELGEESGTLNPADGSNPRLDALDLQVQDDDEDSSGERRARVVYVPGTPAGSPSAPALTPGSERLGTILVPAGGTPSPSVATMARWTVAAGGVLPVRDSGERPTVGLHDGMTVFDASTGALEVRHGNSWVPAGSTSGFSFGQRVTFESAGTFTKGDFPGLRGVMAYVLGGGASGAGCDSTGGGQHSGGGGGGGGGCAIGWIDAGALGTNQAVTVGSGGVGNQTSGAAGGSSSFAGLTGNGGGTSLRRNATSNAFDTIRGGPGGSASGGDINLPGSPGGPYVGSTDRSCGGNGGAGAGPFGGGGANGDTVDESANSASGFGGGGAGNSNTGGDSAASGGDGAAGLVVLDLYF